MCIKFSIFNLQFSILYNFQSSIFNFQFYLLFLQRLNDIDMFGLGTQEILIIALVVLLLFGGKKIPELMKGLGKGVKSFKEGMKEIEDPADEKKTDDETKKE